MTQSSVGVCCSSTVYRWCNSSNVYGWCNMRAYSIKFTLNNPHGIPVFSTRRNRLRSRQGGQSCAPMFWAVLVFMCATANRTGRYGNYHVEYMVPRVTMPLSCCDDVWKKEMGCDLPSVAVLCGCSCLHVTHLHVSCSSPSRNVFEARRLRTSTTCKSQLQQLLNPGGDSLSAHAV